MTVPGHSVEQRIEQIASPLAQALAVELVEISCLGKGAGSCIRVTIDKPGGVGIQDCEALHHSLSRALDVLDPLPYTYRLEVSSPGLDRPLKHRQDYQRALNKLIRVKLLNAEKKNSFIVGHLHEVTDAGICVKPTPSKGIQKPLVTLDWGMFDKGRLEIEF
ncbi:ribosome maturation factor RimP [Candidatus Nitrospira salsa]|nr:MAG: ribosome maturation factor [Nitrospirales bacterium]